MLRDFNLQSIAYQFHDLSHQLMCVDRPSRNIFYVVAGMVGKSNVYEKVVYM